jgi:hypothetical protein
MNRNRNRNGMRINISVTISREYLNEGDPKLSFDALLSISGVGTPNSVLIKDIIVFVIRTWEKPTRRLIIPMLKLLMSVDSPEVVPTIRAARKII